MSDPQPEVMVIGGGATGAGIARDLAMRGTEVLLVEAGDFSSGASGGNHGMLHSGGRYAVKDPLSARECVEENRVLKRIASFCVEDTGGLFVSLPEDDPEYPALFAASCKEAGVEAREVGLDEARRSEPNLSRDITAAVGVPDAAIDPFFLVWGNVLSARQAGATVLNYTPVRSMDVRDGQVVSVTIGDGSERRTVHPELVINAAGAWAGQVASMAGLAVDMHLDKGTMVVFNGRMVNGLVNRLRPPSDGDILVPHRSSTILGTTSGPGDLGAIGPSRDEVHRLLAEAGHLMPGIREARIIRAYSGVRPLLGGNASGRQATRGFQVIDHSPEVDNLVSVIGGKLTTYRLMAERASDIVMGKLGRTGHCRTMLEELVPPAEGAGRSFHEEVERRRYGGVFENMPAQADCIGGEACTCESVSYKELERFAASGDVRTASDLMRRTRAGMGFCQAGLCAFRLAAVLEADPVSQAEAFLKARWKGVEPVLLGDQLRQEAFKAHLFRVYGVDHTARGEK